MTKELLKLVKISIKNKDITTLSFIKQLPVKKCIVNKIDNYFIKNKIIISKYNSHLITK